MQSSVEQHIFVTGACGAGKSTFANALSYQLQIPLHRLEDHPGFRQMLQYKPDLNRVSRSTAICSVASPPSASGPGGGQAITASHHRGDPDPECSRIDHRAQTDIGRYALAPDCPAISGAGSRQVRRGSYTVRRSSGGRAWLCSRPAACVTRSADLRRSGTGDCCIPTTPWGRNCTKSCVQNLVAKAGEREVHGRSCLVNHDLAEQKRVQVCRWVANVMAVVAAYVG
jgi:hypothetical protein